MVGCFGGSDLSFRGKCAYGRSSGVGFIVGKARLCAGASVKMMRGINKQEYMERSMSPCKGVILYAEDQPSTTRECQTLEIDVRV